MHEQWQELIPFYVAGSLSPDDRQALERHLHGCAQCQRALQEWQMIGEAVRVEADSWTKRLPPLSPLVRANLHTLSHESAETVPMRAMVESDTADTPRLVQPRVPSRSWQLTAAAAAVMVVIFGGLLALMVTRSNRDDDSDLTQVAQVMTQTAEDIGAPASTRATRDVSPSATPAVTATSGDLGILSSGTSPVSPTNTAQRPPTGTPPPFGTPTPLSSEAPLAIGGGLGGETTQDDRNAFPLVPGVDPANMMFEPPQNVCTASSGTGQNVDIYASPSVSSGVVSFLPPGEYLYTLVISGDGWYQLTGRNMGLVGWVMGTQINLTGECSALVLPSPTIDGTFTPTPTRIDIVQFVAVPDFPERGDTITLVWETRGALSISIRVYGSDVNPIASSPDILYDNLPTLGTLDVILPPDYAHPGVTFILSAENPDAIDPEEQGVQTLTFQSP